MKEFIDKTSTQSGTPINRSAMMGVQGFENANYHFDGNGSVIMTNGDGHTLTMTFNNDRSIVQTFVGEKSITKTITINQNGTVSEVLS